MEEKSVNEGTEPNFVFSRDEAPVDGNEGGGVMPDAKQESLVRVSKSIIVEPPTGQDVDSKTVAFQFYNCFNYFLLPRDKNDVRLTLGITSANPGEGKTHVAANLAVSLALGYRRNTIIVDLNIQNPRVHKVFGTSLHPGLLNSLNDETLHVWQTKIEHLFVLAAGIRHNHARDAKNFAHMSKMQRMLKEPSLGLQYTNEFGDILYSLERTHDFIIVDMPAVNSKQFPVLFANHLDGLIVVVDTTKTKRRDVDKILRRLNEKQIFGFVLNKVKDENF